MMDFKGDFIILDLFSQLSTWEAEIQNVVIWFNCYESIFNVKLHEMYTTYYILFLCIYFDINVDQNERQSLNRLYFP